MTVSKNQIKLIKSLELKKNRKENKLFLAEGPKVVGDLWGHFRCRLLVAIPAWAEAHPFYMTQTDNAVLATENELQRASLLKTPQQVLAVFEQPGWEVDANVITQSLCLGLDGVQDPGNLGTIVRLADWFGIENIFCSHDTADIFNPKAVQATMGALARVRVSYVNMPELIRSVSNIPIYGTFLDGTDIYRQELSENGLIVMGNEGNGISNEVASLINRKLLIPNYPPERATSESLNVAIATAVVCAEFRRRAGH